MKRGAQGGGRGADYSRGNHFSLVSTFLNRESICVSLNQFNQVKMNEGCLFIIINNDTMSRPASKFIGLKCNTENAK